MLPKSQRLTAEELDTVMGKGRVAHSSLFLIRVLSGTEEVKYAAVAPQKIFKTAVQRSAVRRKIYKTLRDLPMPITPGHIILIAKAGVADAATDQLTSDMKALFVKSGIIR